ncbi:Ff.00g097120.m01.CDS01 [Fusarium sp. VM40]|nr:Ff.00g097120.m01.CDS01 [Fusarium sp. VM40]
MDSHNQQRLPAPKLAGLNNILNSDHAPAPIPNGPPHMRDSGFYSNADASSKHTSAASFNVNGLSPSPSGYQSSSQDKTPSPIAANMVPHGLVSPSTTNMSVAAMVSPSTPGSLDPRRDRPTSIESNGPVPGPVPTMGDTLAPGMAGLRRESVDSRMNQVFSDMRLGNSPYTSNNPSTTSIQNTLHSQRNPHHLSVHRISNSYQPSAERNPETKTVKTAPAITGPATGHIARAAEPTKGQAWAFPEEEIQRVGTELAYTDSRRSSITESVASSQFTTESRLPPGQMRLNDSDYSRMSNASEFLPVHHHSMQHKQLSDLQAEEGNGATGNQPYSRTPELRVSHKLAERKRRTEMKELFDQLRDLMPQERGSKASKWEILTKAIAEHQKQHEHIRLLQSHYNTAAAENEMLRREIQGLRMEGAQMRGGSSSSHPAPPSSAATPAPQAGSYQQDHYANSNRPELPPIRSLSNGISNGPDSMTGVQYDSPRTNGYHPERY